MFFLFFFDFLLTGFYWVVDPGYGLRFNNKGNGLFVGLGMELGFGLLRFRIKVN